MRASQSLFDQVLTHEAMLSQFNLLLDIFERADAYGTFRPVERPGQVLLMLAEDDRGFTPEERDAFRASYPDARVHLFHNGGHLAGF